jgi:CheY-like chemotaxis protein
LFRTAAADAKWFSPIAEFENGNEVIQYLERSAHALPALILLDLKMPGADGFEVLRWFRTHREWEAVPVVVLTNSNQENDRRDAASLGATEYRVKPTSYRELVRLAVDLRRAWLVRDWTAASPRSPKVAGRGA